MNLSFVTVMCGAPWGGSEELWYHTALLSRAAGDLVCAAVPDLFIDEGPLKALKDAGVQTLEMVLSPPLPKPLPIRVFKKVMGLDDRSRTNRYAEALKRSLPDVICVSQGGTFDISPHSWLYDLLISGDTPFVIICHHNTEHGGRLGSRHAGYELALFDKAAAVLFVSKRNLLVTERQLARRLTNALIIQNPVNIDVFGPLSFPRRDTLKMASVGRLETAAKGQDILLEALGSPLWRDRDYRLSLYGTGPDQKYLSRLIRLYGLERKVVLAGFCSDVRSIWQDHDVLVLPSISEGTPLSLVEAMLCGRPAVVTDVGGMADYVIDGKTGYLATGPTVAALSYALEKLWVGRDQLPEQGMSAYKYASFLRDPRPEQTLLNLLYRVAG